MAISLVLSVKSIDSLGVGGNSAKEEVTAELFLLCLYCFPS